ncbi:hypothetical protein F8388_014782 [Cannabis sativa]|uniref:mRNA export factor GLE1 n=1 Tax=Cannabis sativa TaxID=3483 RepID=A0A7J6H144_CANSA|nr:hypothetical protein F8388_014782 [Cannabis sativa]
MATVVSHYAKPGSFAFACGYVLVLVTAEVPHLMDLILAELHKACIYTVPKHIVYTQVGDWGMSRVEARGRSEKE